MRSAFDVARPFQVSRRQFLGLTMAACLVFTAYAGSFLYFFVDDEAIPLVYARNLLRGRGLVYTALEGRSEGYSDFLHVIWSTLVLLASRALHLPPLSPLLIGKAISFVAALAIIVVTARWLRRTGTTPAGLAAALASLALAGPLAVWACSSLETAIFALMVTGFAAALAMDARRASVMLGVAVILERLDGIVFVAALVIAAVVADPRRRRAVWAVTWPVGAAAMIFHAWRLVFFGSLLSEPLAAKVLYRLAGAAGAVVKPTDTPYLVALLKVYGVIAAPAFLAAIVFAWRVPAARMAAVAMLLLGIYVGVVGDWMFGWRFTVALYPLAALIVGVAVSRASPIFGWCVAVLVMLWSGVAARNVLAAYVEKERRPVFWTHPRLGAAAWLAPYSEVISASRNLMHPGDRVAYNQAGLLPYLLDLENIDDLGICSHFVARLPTTDVYYTGVGRYSPLTNQPVLRTAHAYLLYQDVQFLITPTDLLWRANHDTIPDILLDGYFTRVALDASGSNAIYQRTGKPATAYRRDPSVFRENLAHTSRLTRAALGGTPVAPAAFGPQLPFLRERAGTFDFTGVLEIDLGFGTQDAEVSALYIGRVTSRVASTMTLSLYDGAGRETLQRTVAIAAPGAAVLEPFGAVRARAASLTFRSDGSNRVTLDDMRIEGQSEVLRDYLRRTLRFPAP